MKSSILTFSGKSFDVLDPSPEMIDLEDIASALSKLCRFGGHAQQFYSVAEHCTLASRMAEKISPSDRVLMAWALMHDASEAYLVDLPRPIKGQLPDYVRLEDSIQQAISKRFDLPWPMPDEVHQIDGDMLAFELRKYMNVRKGHRFEIKPSSKGIDLLPESASSHALARSDFMARASLLGLK